MSDVEQAKTHFFSALDHLDAKDFAAAETDLRAALAIVPDRVSALSNLAVALFEQDKVADAIATAKRATELGPEDFEGWLALGSSQCKHGALDEALAAMESAVAAAPDNPRTLMGRASVFIAMRRYDDAGADYRAAMRLSPDEPDLLGLAIAAQMYACDWRGLDAATAKHLAGLRDGSRRGDPFTLLAMPGTPADQLACGRDDILRHYPSMPPLYRGETHAGDRIRIAYVSGDMREHPAAQLLVGLFERHDRARFEIFCISHGADDGSAVRARIAVACEHFVDMHGRSDNAVAEYIHANAIDIAVDLGGFTSSGRLRIFAARPAPIQVSFLGFPGTTGAPYIDYIVGDPVVIPAGSDRFYSESVVRLPHSYYPNDDRRRIAPETPARAEAGLPATAFVYCSFNNSYKFNPPLFEIWMRLLAATPGSVLWLLDSNRSAPDNLRREAAARGIAPERLVFASSMPVERHLARHRIADLALDTSPYNAHTTAADALWAGLPLITCPGETFASRVAASLLHAVGLPELVAASFAEYEALALALESDPPRLQGIRARLAANRDTTPLFDTTRFARHMEAAYATMVERHRRGAKPAALTVPADS